MPRASRSVGDHEDMRSVIAALRLDGLDEDLRCGRREERTICSERFCH